MPGARARSMTKSSAWLLPPTVFSPAKRRKHRGAEAIPWSARRAPSSHRRGESVEADADAVGFERTVRQPFQRGDHLGAGLQLGLVGGGIGHDRRIRWHNDFLLAILVFDQEGVTILARDALGHGRVGHGAVRP